MACRVVVGATLPSIDSCGGMFDDELHAGWFCYSDEGVGCNFRMPSFRFNKGGWGASLTKNLV